MALTFTPTAETDEVFPTFQLKGMDEKIYSDSDFRRGKPIVVVFMCNHCPYVKSIEDRLIELGRDLKNLQVPMIGICSNNPDEYPEDNFKNLQNRFREKNYSFTYLHDPDQKVAAAFGAVCTPDFFVYDQAQRLMYRGRLDDSWKDPSRVTRRELFESVQKLLRGEPIGNDVKPSMGCSIKW